MLFHQSTLILFIFKAAKTYNRTYLNLMKQHVKLVNNTVKIFTFSSGTMKK